MSLSEIYIVRVQRLLADLSLALTIDEQREVTHLADHGEPAEALRTLAWIVVDGDRRIPAEAIAAIRELTAGLIDESDLPDNLDSYASS
ncbi:hypothetical protein [Hydrogenophaga sp. R2]|uniref:hypothetical protein n=1 Tax=Hydrogenophaga sp. R2 TaxID=3132827 RepID=UPI003CE9D624